MTTTTKRLAKEMYGHEFRPNPNALFGLRAGQMRSTNKVTHNSGWYNRDGEKLGWGDLSAEDIRRITSELQDDELFIILYESDSFWNFVTRPGLTGNTAQVKPDVNAPGVDYVAEKCCLVVAKGTVYHIPCSMYNCKEGDETEIRGGVRAKVLTRESAKAMITAS